MTNTLTHLLTRGAELRRRFEAERARTNHDPMKLLRLRSLLLRLERRLQALVTPRAPQRLVLAPVALRQPNRLQFSRG